MRGGLLFETGREADWDQVYLRSGARAVSWFRPRATTSLRLIDALGIGSDSAVLDVGGGASLLAASLARRGWRDVTVLDVSQQALDACQRDVAATPASVRCIRHDLLTWQPQRRYDLWHDRALLHFFVDDEQRGRYVARLEAALALDGAVVIGVFAEDGPTRCSNLPVVRYSLEHLTSLLGDGFQLIAHRRETHRTPGGATQPFQWAAFRRRVSTP